MYAQSFADERFSWTRSEVIRVMPTVARTWEGGFNSIKCKYFSGRRVLFRNHMILNFVATRPVRRPLGSEIGISLLGSPLSPSLIERLGLPGVADI